ncbi:CRTAC1 family protein [Paraglaciecola aquimarina]|uniref:CRTAC1 family protein n=1 Tax=Paraglaciecola algarum TaxID=3050085 RepID=A0ABS9DB29_9ALTE|nr:CRTAC1 family protein [Paraglaciecola sp. G1-23]MCF2949924.1 CRTAC1 family protein [Paraglaciecola sp. G1-23]
MNTNLLPYLISPLVLFSLVSCGGGSSSSPVQPTSPPAVTPPATRTGVAVLVESVDPNDNTSHQCHSANNAPAELNFVDITSLAGINYSHSMPNGDGILEMSGGIAAGDFDNDGWVDLYAVGGDGQPNLLLKNMADGTFSDVAEFAEVNQLFRGSGPAFGDLDGDGRLDLFVGSVGGSAPKLFLSRANDKFLDITQSSGLVLPGNNFGATWGDYDKDDDLDLVITHWSSVSEEHYPYFWRNNGDNTFTDVSTEVGITEVMQQFGTRDKSFTPNFADINNDGWQDLLLVSDNHRTRIFINNKDGTFSDTTDREIISDNAGMGSAIGDYDNDGDIDWFVSAITFKDGVTHFGSLTPGNRLYQNQGDGTFIDKTDEAGVRDGYWGWGACFADFDNDTNLDIFHVNGMQGENIDERFLEDPSRLFMSNGDGTFTESSEQAGIIDNDMGRGLVCFDYDKDGDLDLYVANYNQPPKLFCNSGSINNFVNIKLREKSKNTQALGARIIITANNTEQMRELRTSNNYVSQNPVEAHFGLGQATKLTQVKIIWPDGKQSELTDLNINQFITITRDD